MNTAKSEAEEELEAWIAAGRPVNRPHTSDFKSGIDRFHDLVNDYVRRYGKQPTGWHLTLADIKDIAMHLDEKDRHRELFLLVTVYPRQVHDARLLAIPILVWDANITALV